VSPAAYGIRTVLPRRTATSPIVAIAAGHEHDREALVKGVALADPLGAEVGVRPPSGSRPLWGVFSAAGSIGSRFERLERGLPAELEVLGAVVDAELFHSTSTERSVGSCSSSSRIPPPIACSVPAGRGSRHRPAQGPRGGPRASRRRPARRPSGARSPRRAAP
jgi:hypothetical protein